MYRGGGGVLESKKKKNMPLSTKSDKSASLWAFSLPCPKIWNDYPAKLPLYLSLSTEAVSGSHNTVP